jgi:hypothetical protein
VTKPRSPGESGNQTGGCQSAGVFVRAVGVRAAGERGESRVLREMCARRDRASPAWLGIPAYGEDCQSVRAFVRAVGVSAQPGSVCGLGSRESCMGHAMRPPSTCSLRGASGSLRAAEPRRLLLGSRRLLSQRGSGTECDHLLPKSPRAKGGDTRDEADCGCPKKGREGRFGWSRGVERATQDGVVAQSIKPS